MRYIYMMLLMLCIIWGVHDNGNALTEITPFVDPKSIDIYSYGRGYNKIQSFVISEPPKNKDCLLLLVYKHFQSFALNDSIEKYLHYHHSYYKETRHTYRDYRTTAREDFYEDYLYKGYNDLLVDVTVSSISNYQEIKLYDHRKKDRLYGEIYIKTYNNEKNVHIAMHKLPTRKNGLLRLISDYHRLYIQNDTIGKYVYNIHKYHEPLAFGHFNYIGGAEIREDVLIVVTIEPRVNKQEIFYIKGEKRP